MTIPSAPESPPDGEAGVSPTAVLAALPRGLRARAAPLVAGGPGRLLLDVVGGLARAQVFDRSMTIAAQAFTSIFPLLIMVATLFGAAIRDRFREVLALPETSTRLLQEAMSGSRSNAFGVVGSLIVLLSATSLTRALGRAYRSIWSVPASRTGAAATARQIAAVGALVLFVVGARLVDGLTALTPTPHAAGAVMTALLDCALATVLPRLLLGPVPHRSCVLVSGCAFGALMVVVRAAGTIWLPRTLEISADRYGIIGIAFAYISWLYALSFCLLLAAVLGAVLSGPADDLWSRLPDLVPHGWRVPASKATGSAAHRGLAEETSMTETESRATRYEPPAAATGWVGLVAFAGMMLLVGGGCQVFQGIVALAQNDYYLVEADGLMLSLDFTAWGWIHLAIGSIAFVTGFGVLYGKVWACVVGVVLAVLNAVAQLLFASAYPIWSVLIVVVDVLVIYALTVHGREVRY